MIRLNKNGVRWDLEPDFAPLLDEVLASPGQVVKESVFGRVAVHRAGGKNFYVKTYRHAASFWRPGKFFFKPSQAQREWRLAQAFAARNVPIVRHVADGERWSARGLLESILITEEFVGDSLDKSPNAEPQKVLDFVNLLHNRGVLQHDLHPLNILVGPTGELRLVDLQRAEVKDDLNGEERAYNLAYLHMTYPLPVKPFIANLSADIRKKHLADRAHHCLGRNGHFAPKQFGALTWQTRLASLNTPAEKIMADPDGFLAGRAKLFKSGRSATVGAADGLVLKRYNLRKYLNLIKDLLRPSKARSSFRKAYHLELVGIPTARAIATADVRRLRFLFRSYFLMEEIRDAVPLEKWQGDVTVAIRRLAALLAKLHNEGFRHRDLKETNILFDANGNAVLIDLEGLIFMGDAPNYLALADLRRFERGMQKFPQFSRANWIAFVRHYCRLRKLHLVDLSIKRLRPKNLNVPQPPVSR